MSESRAAFDQGTEPSSDEQIAHGGNLAQACQQWGGSPADWLDLSTGLSPYPYPVSEVPSHCWQALPYLQADFLAATQRYYRPSLLPDSYSMLACSGSQALIALLPYLLKAQPILLPELGYQEYQRAWQLAGQPWRQYPSWDEPSAVLHLDQQLALNPRQHLLLIQPNNPSGILFSQQQVLNWAAALDGTLIVDEAFIDQRPEQSMLNLASLPNNLLLLRSFGKFFGLAGLRLAFAFGSQPLINRLQQHLGSWPVNGPSQWLAKQGLQDQEWQQQQRQRHQNQMQAQQQLLAPLLRAWQVSWQQQQGLFCSWLLTPKLGKELAELAAKERILLRYWHGPKGTLVRMGLCADLPRLATFTAKLLSAHSQD